MILGVNFAIKPYSVCLKTSDECRDIYDEHDVNYAENLAMHIKNGLLDMDKSFTDLTAVYCVKGPGNYTSLRLSLTTVKMIASLVSIPLYVTSTLWGIGANLLGLDGVYLSVIPARREDVHVALLGVKSGKLSPISPDFVWTKSQALAFFEEQKGHITLIGKIPDWMVSMVDSQDNCSYIASILKGESLFDLHQADPEWTASYPAEVVPFYAYESVVGEKKSNT